MDQMNSVSIAIAWCLAWGNERKSQFDVTVLQEMREVLRNGGEVPEEVKEIVQQLEELQGINEDYFPKTLEELKTKYADLWNQTTKLGLVYGGVTKVKQYVFEASNPHSAPQNVTEGNYGDENQREHQNKQIK
jgi:CRISPR-associated protein Cmr2